MNCQEYRSMIEDALDDSLQGELGEVICRHLEHCPECRGYLAMRRQEHSDLFMSINAAYSHSRPPPADFTDRLIAAVAPRHPLPFFLRMPRWALMAASVAIMFMGVVFAGVVVEHVISSAKEEAATNDVPESEAPQETLVADTQVTDTGTGDSYMSQEPSIEEVALSEQSDIADAISTTKTETSNNTPSASTQQNGGDEKMNIRKTTTALAAAFALAAGGAQAGSTTYYQIAGTSDETSIISMDGLAFEEAITKTPTLAFPDIKLDDIPVGASFVSAMWGDWGGLPSTMGAAVPAIGFCEQRCDTDNDGHCDKIALQVCVEIGNNMRGVVIFLTNGEGGVYVARHGRFGLGGSDYTTPYFSLGTNGNISWTSSAQNTATDEQHYILQGLRVHGMSPVNTAPRLAFRGATLEDVKDSSFMAGYQFGSWMTSATVSNAAAFVSTWCDGNDGNKLKKVVMQFRASTGATAVIELTDGVGGVYAQQVLGVNDINNANTKAFAINDETGAVTMATGTDRGADKYGIHDFVIQFPPCVKGTPTKIWSDVTLADIESGKFTARFSGRSGQSEGTIFIPDSAIGCNKKLRYDNNSNLTNLVVEFQTQSGNNVRCVVVSFTDDGSDVYATGLGARYANGTVGNYEFYKEDGTFKGSSIDFADTHTGNYYGVCDLRVKMPTEWTLDQDRTWSELKGGATLASDEVVRIKVTDADAVLTVNEDVEVAGIEFVDGTGATLQVNSGYTVTAESVSGIGNILNNGTLVKTGDGVATMPFNNASTGVTIVSNGTLKVASVTGTGTSHTVRVKDGATFDLNCVWKTAVAVVLEDGANFANSGSSDAVWGSALNIRRLTLEGNATVTATHTFGLRVPSHGSNILDLGTYTLTVKASSGKSFFVDNTTINGTGKILVASGTLFSYSDSYGDTYTLEVGASGTLAGGGNGITCGNFVNHGSINSSNNKIIVKGTLTPDKSLIYLKLVDGATVKASTTQAQVVSTTFSASGTYTIDASEITKGQFVAAENQRIAVLTVPTAEVDGSWAVTNSPLADVRAKWVDNGDDTSTLYLCKSPGTIFIIR